MVNVSRLWRNRDMADVQLVLLRQEDSREHKTKQGDMIAKHGNGDAAERVLEELPAHRVVLACASGFFNAQLMHWDCQHENSSDKARLRLSPAAHPSSVLRVIVSDGQLPAALLLLELLYKEHRMTLPASAALVMQMAVLADQWEALQCLDTCMQLLAHLPPDQLTAADVAQLMADELPGPILGHAARCDVLCVCRQRLLQLFGEVRAVVVNEQLRLDFCLLPFAAVKLWAEQDELAVDSENSVAVLLTHWWLANTGVEGGAGGTAEQKREQKCEQKRELAGLLRLSHLSNCYLHMLTFNSDGGWFKPDKSKLQQFMQLRSTTDCPTDPMPVALRNALPPAWFKPPRTASQLMHTLQWEVQATALQQLHERAAIAIATLISPEGMYWAGYTWHLMVHLADQKAALMLAAKAKPAPGLDEHLPLSAFMSIAAQFAIKEAATGQYDKVLAVTSRWFQASVGSGSTTVLGVPSSDAARADSRLPDSLMIDGKVWLQLTMQSLS